jgi:hypothetical protein
MITKHALAAALTLGSLSLAGCPQLAPPFDASGSYGGDFAVGLGDLELIDGCGMLVTLEHDVEGLPIANGKVTGTVTLSFGCVLPEDLALLANGGGGAFGAGLAALGTGGLGAGVASLLNLPPIEVTGLLLPDGTLELNTPDILEECTGGDCVKLGLLGKGIDSDGDGRMDWFDGTFGGTLGTSLGGLPVVGEFSTSTLE